MWRKGRLSKNCFVLYSCVVESAHCDSFHLPRLTSLRKLDRHRDFGNVFQCSPPLARTVIQGKVLPNPNSKSTIDSYIKGIFTIRRELPLMLLYNPTNILKIWNISINVLVIDFLCQFIFEKFLSGGKKLWSDLKKVGGSWKKKRRIFEKNGRICKKSGGKENKLLLNLYSPTFAFRSNIHLILTPQII